MLLDPIITQRRQGGHGAEGTYAREADGGVEEAKMRKGRREIQSINIIVKCRPHCTITGRGDRTKDPPQRSYIPPIPSKSLS